MQWSASSPTRQPSGGASLVACCSACADGGRYAEPSLVTHRANLAALHTYVSQQQSQQQAKLAELRTELTGSISDAQDKIEALLPSYKQDMALVEVLAQKVDGARRKATAALSSNTQAADSISTLLEELRGCLVKAPAAGGQGQQAGRAAGFGGGAPRTECQQLLESVNKLRQQVHRQSQVSVLGCCLLVSCRLLTAGLNMLLCVRSMCCHDSNAAWKNVAAFSGFVVLHVTGAGFAAVHQHTKPAAHTCHTS